jgi:hypothetical protein
MRNIERIILMVLLVILILGLIFMVGNHFGLLDIPNQKIINASLFGFLVSGFSMIIFPLWSVGNYLKTNSVKKILDYRIRYRMPYVGLTVSFIGSMVLSIAEKYSERFLLSLALCVIGGSFLSTGLVIVWLSCKDKKAI